MDSEAIEEVAARWYARRQSGTWTDEDEAQLERWLEANVAHRIHFIRVDTAWKQAARLKALGAGVPAGKIPDRGSWGDARFFPGGAADAATPTPEHATATSSATRWRPARVGLVAVAASVVLAIAAGVSWIYAERFRGDAYSTPVGGLNRLELNDGSHVILNTDSRIRVELRENERRIALKRGEAFFEVVSDPARPFVVEAGNKRVVAVGTKFSVRRDTDDIQVVVTEGKVRVETNDSWFAGRGPEVHVTDGVSDRGHGVLLAAGGIARTEKNEVLVRERDEPAAEQMLSWRNGYLVFRETRLGDAVAEFNRYNARKIVIEDPAIAAIRIGGNFRTSNTDSFLSLLQSAFPISVERGTEAVVLKAR